jgi:hypothetical protein
VDEGDDTPPFGVPAVPCEEDGSGRQDGRPAPDPGGPAVPTGATGPAGIRDRLIELDDLRQRRIISEEEFAAKKAELLNRI